MTFLTPEEWAAVRLSLLVGLFVVVGSLPLAVAMGYGLARYRFPGKWLCEVTINLPLVLPPVVTGYLLLLSFRPESLFGKWLSSLGIQVAFDWKGLVVAAGLMSFPLMVRAIRLGFQGVDPHLEVAARTLGAGWWRTFATISLPLASRGILAGCVLGFARSLGEFGATVMLVSSRESTQTIPLLIYSMRDRVGGLQQTWRLVMISIVLSAVALAASEYIERRGTQRDTA